MKNTTKINPRSPDERTDLLQRQVRHREAHPALMVSKHSLTTAIEVLSKKDTPIGTQTRVDYDGSTITVKRTKTAVVAKGFQYGGSHRYHLSHTDSTRDQTPQSKQGFDNMTVAQLKDACRTAGIKGFSSMTKNDLIRTLNADYLAAFNGQGEEE